MQFEIVSKWIGLLSNIGVLAGLIILIIEISQNTNATRSQIYQQRASENATAYESRGGSEIHRRIYSVISSENSPENFAAIDSLSAEDKYTLRVDVEASIRRLDANLYHCEIGFLQGVICAEFEQIVKNLLPYWDKVLSTNDGQIGAAFTRIISLREP